MNEELVYNIIELVMPFLGIGLAYMVVYMIYYAIRSEHKQKMALIDKGMDPSLINKKYHQSRAPRHHSNFLKNGLFFIGLAIGILLGYLLQSNSGMTEWVAYPSMILVFGGIALITYHLIERQKQETVKP